VVAGAGSQPACPPDVTNCEAYRAGANIGTGLAVAAILGVWFVGFIILSIIWFMTRPARRVCPACGTEARKGQQEMRTQLRQRRGRPNFVWLTLDRDRLESP
jgi:hypothetical protein